MTKKSTSRKKPESAQPVVSGKILESAKKSISTDILAAPAKIERCQVCGADVAPNSTEQLCWVCRRLKISAWMDSEQMSAQE